MRETEALLFGLVIVAVAGFHLVHGLRTGRILWRGGPVRRAENPVGFWAMMSLSALMLLAGLWLGIFGLPDPQ